MNRRGELYVAGQLALMTLVLLGPKGWHGLPPWPAALVQVGTFAGATLIAAGAALTVWGMVALGRNLAAVPRPKPDATLVECGPYRYLRHPMYAGASLAAFGWALAVHGWLTLGYAALLVAFFAWKARREERWLREELPGYEEYQTRVRALPLGRLPEYQGSKR